MDLATMTEHTIVLQITFVYPEMLNPIIRTFVFKCNGGFFGSWWNCILDIKQSQIK